MSVTKVFTNDTLVNFEFHFVYFESTKITSPSSATHSITDSPNADFIIRKKLQNLTRIYTLILFKERYVVFIVWFICQSKFFPPTALGI